MSGRRAKGDGSVYRRKNSRYIGEYVDANGKRRYVSGKTRPKLKYEPSCVRLWPTIRASVRESTHESYEKPHSSSHRTGPCNVKLDQLNALQVQAHYRAKLDDALK